MMKNPTYNIDDSVWKANIEELFASVNEGTMNPKQIDWKPCLLQMLSMQQQTQPCLPSVIWVNLLVVKLALYDDRIYVLHQFQQIAPQIFASKREIDTFIQDCDCVCYLCHSLTCLSYNNKVVKPVYNNTVFDELTLILSEITPAEMVALSQSLYDRTSDVANQDHFFFVMRIGQYLHKLLTNDICEFSKTLFLAESYRKYIMSGEKNEQSIANIHTLPIRLRNDCFDVYIQLRTTQILKDLEADNARLYPPTKLKAMQTLLTQDAYAVNRMAGLKQFKNSYAYAQQWYPGADDVLTMAQFFLQYLKDKIKALSYSNTKIVTQEVHVQGDYVAGSKQVGTHIGNVSPNAVGIQHNPSTQPE